MVFGEFAVGQVFLSMMWFFLFFIWIYMLIVVFGDIFRSNDLSGWAKALWTIGIVVFPYLGVFVYLIARGGKMADARGAEPATVPGATRRVRAVGGRQRWPEHRLAAGATGQAARSGSDHRGGVRGPQGQGDGGRLIPRSP